MIKKCGEQTKLLYRSINKKLKCRESTARRRDGKCCHENPKEMTQLQNKFPQKIFTKETECESAPGIENRTQMRDRK